MNPGEIYSDDLPQEESRDGSLLVRIHVPELNVSKCLQFPADRIIWEIKNQVLALLPKELKEGFNYGLFCPPSNGKAGKFLDEERRLGDYPFNGPVGYLELKYKRRVYKMLNLDEKQLKALHTRANLRRFIDCVNAGYLEKITKMCAKGLDPNFHCSDTGETPLTLATATKKSNKLLIALVNGGALLDYRTKDGSTALHKAVERDCLEAVTTLLELGASPNYRDGKGLTPLYLSETKRCDPKICESLLHDHATIGTKDTQGWQEVHQACRNGLVQHLELLLLYGADMDARNASGNTPLHVCAVNNQEACAKLLLYRGSQINAHNYANQTAYQVAVIAGNLELAEMIRNYKPEDAVRFHKPPRYNQRRRSGIGWGTNTLLYNLSHSDSPPSPSPSDQPFSSASSSLSEGSSSHRSHEDDISLVTDKSLGDTSDIVSDSSGVGTNSDSTVCSVDHINQTVICVEPYNSNLAGHLNIQPGDYIDIVSSTDCGFLEGYIRGTNLSGFFPSTCIREISLKEKIENTLIGGGGGGGGSGIMIMGVNDENQNVTLRNQQNGGMGQYHQLQQQQLWHQQQMSRTMNSINMKKITLVEPRSVVLHRAKRNFGFILRGAKAASPLMDLKPSDRCPALQYLDDVDPGGVADLAGLKPGDFLLAINGQDVRCASHEHVVEMIRSSGSLVSMTVVSQRVEAIPNLSNLSSNNSTNNFEQSNAVSNNIYTSRQCVTLPRKMGGIVGRVTAPTPPRRDPTTTLSVGRARAKSMVAGLESNDIEKDEEDILASTKSVSTESVHQRLPFSGVSTPTSQPRTASIKSRPTSSRITAAELEELFQRQQGENRGDNRYSAMMTTSRFQSGIDSGSSTPPVSPQKGPIVYASVAEMKRKKTGGKVGSIKGKPCPIPNVNTSGLNRNFHSTPDLASQMKRSSSMLTINNWTGTIGFKGHRSQDDINTMRRHLPPPNHPPPPPPIGQVVKVEVSRKSEYESTAGLQQKIVVAAQESEIMSSFKPASNAKLYASPQSIKTVEYRSRIDSNTGTMKKSASFHKPISNIAANQPNQTVVHHTAQHPITVNTNNLNIQPQHQNQMAMQMTSPPIPDPDYSLSESDDDDDEENSVMLARNTKFNANNLADIAQQQPIETSGTSNTSSESASSIPHSFSVDEIRNIRNKLKSSKSFPNNFTNGGNTQSNHLKPNSHQIKVIHMSAHNKNEEGDNSSSGVSSDQEMAMNNSQMTNNLNNSNNSINNSNNSSIVKPKKIFNPNEPIVDGEDEDDDDERHDDDDDDGDRSPSPPIIGFQRHNSMTRKQASLVMARGTLQRPAVSLVQLPPPIENDSENESSVTAPPPIKKFIDLQITPTNEPNSDFIVLAPPPQFCDQVDSRCDEQDQPLPPPPPPLTNLTGTQQSHHQQRTVRIVGAVPKSNTIISKPQPSNKW